jgi:hypothetical protein
MEVTVVVVPVVTLDRPKAVGGVGSQFSVTATSTVAQGQGTGKKGSGKGKRGQPELSDFF